MKKIIGFLTIAVLATCIIGCGPSTDPQVPRENGQGIIIDENGKGGEKNTENNNAENSAAQNSGAQSNTGLSAKDMFEQGIVPDANSPVSNAGDYKLDEEKTKAQGMNGNIATLDSIFDKYSDGAAMKLSDDGKFAFYVGSYGGAGTWKQDGACMKCNVTDYVDHHEYEVVLNPFQEGSRTYVVMWANGVNLYWYK